MGRDNSIWFRRQTGWWMTTIGGQQVKLAEGRQNRQEALSKFHELAAVQVRPADAPDARVADLIEAFLSRGPKDVHLFSTGDECRGDRVEVFLDGQKIHPQTSLGLRQGAVGFRAAGPQERGLYRNVSLRNATAVP